jgi:predicted peptidase
MKTTLNTVIFRGFWTAGLASVCMGASAPCGGKEPYNPVSGFQGYDFKGESMVMPYRLLTPENIGPSERCPLILMMHGMGSIGDDNAKQLFVAGLAANNPAVKNERVFILAPQCPETDRWVKNDGWNALPRKFEPEPTKAMKTAMEILDYVIKTYPVDTDRIYAGGASMGGFAVWDMLARRPGFFAAAFPVCGGGCADQAASVAKTPVWAFHGLDDKAVLPWNSKDMIDAVLKAGGEAKLTEYPGVQHDSWNPALNDQELFRWVFSHRKTEKQR